MLVSVGDYMLGAERTHVEPDGGAAGAAVVEKGDGAFFGLRVLLEISHVKHTGNGICILRLFRLVEGELAAWDGLAVKTELGVVHVVAAHGDGAGDSGVVDALAASGDGALGGDFGGRSLLGGLVGGFVGGCLDRGLGFGGGVVIGASQGRQEEASGRKEGGERAGT